MGSARSRSPVGARGGTGLAQPEGILGSAHGCPGFGGSWWSSLCWCSCSSELSPGAQGQGTTEWLSEQAWQGVVPTPTAALCCGLPRSTRICVALDRASMYGDCHQRPTLRCVPTRAPSHVGIAGPRVPRLVQSRQPGCGQAEASGPGWPDPPSSHRQGHIPCPQRSSVQGWGRPPSLGAWCPENLPPA